jgi:hypothetical protein
MGTFVEKATVVKRLSFAGQEKQTSVSICSTTHGNLPFPFA